MPDQGGGHPLPAALQHWRKAATCGLDPNGRPSVAAGEEMPSTLPRCRTRSGPVLRHYSLRVERRLAGTVGVTHGPGAGSGAPHSRPRAADHAPAEPWRPGLGITSDSDMDWSLCTTTLVTCAPPRPRSTTARLGRDPPQPAAAQEPPSSGARTWVRTPTPVPPGLLTPHVGARARHPSAPYPTLPGPSREGPSTSTATAPDRTRAGTNTGQSARHYNTEASSQYPAPG